MRTQDLALFLASLRRFDFFNCESGLRRSGCKKFKRHFCVEKIQTNLFSNKINKSVVNGLNPEVSVVHVV